MASTRAAVTEAFMMVQRLGGGGFSEVFLARDLRPKSYGEARVIKKLRPGIIHRDPVFLDSLLAEAEVGMMVHSPHVVRVEGVLEVEGEPALVMEHVPGTRLDHIASSVDEVGLPAEAVAEIIRQTCVGLASIHSVCDASGEPLRVVHQDVKPSNIMITPNGLVKLLDLGLARPQRGIPTHLWIRQGTPGYRSPEQLRGDVLLTPASDLYSLGIIMYELLRGGRLFPELQNDISVTLDRQRQLSLGMEVLSMRFAPPGLDLVLQKLCAFELSERYPRAELVSSDLTAWQGAWRSRLTLADFLERLRPRLDAYLARESHERDLQNRDTEPGELRVHEEITAPLPPEALENAMLPELDAASPFSSVPMSPGAGVRPAPPAESDRPTPAKNEARGASTMSGWIRRLSTGMR